MSDNGSARPPHLRLGIAGVLAGLFLGMLDSYIVATALPSIVGDLGGFSLLTWMITSYALAIAASTQIWGKLSDLYNRRSVFLASVVTFLAGSILCGLSRNMGELIGFRALQGIGAGGLLVGALAMVSALLPPAEATRVSSWTGVLLGVALVGGPLIGGVLTEFLSWRWIFYVNAPFGLLCLVGIAVAVRIPDPPKRTVRIDYLGALLLVVAAVGVTLLTTWAGRRFAWDSTVTLGLGVVVAGALGLLVVVERRAAEPMVPFRMFGARNFGLAQVLGFAFNLTMVAAVTFLPLYYQNARGVGSIGSGLLLSPLMVGMVVVMRGGSAHIRRTGRYRILPIVGGAAVTVGMLLVLLLGPETSLLLAALATIPLGVGLGCLIQNTMLILRTSVAPRDLGAAMGLGSLTRTLGGGLGAALFGALYARALSGALTDRLGPGGADELLTGDDGRPGPGGLARLSGPTREAWSVSVTAGVHAVALAAVIAGGVALVAAYFVREVPLADVRPPTPAAAERS